MMPKESTGVLAEELQFLTTYLDLEKLRFGEKFSYRIEIGEGVSQKEQVPKLVLQTFAENAIKHGIMPRAEGGILKIRADRENDYLKLTVEDNGIGRAAAAGHSPSTGKGLKITGEFYEILNQINKKPIKHLITDLHNEKGTPAGTRVEVWVPVEIMMRIFPILQIFPVLLRYLKIFIIDPYIRTSLSLQFYFP